MDANASHRLHVLIDGRVQGVGFRNYAQAKADLLGLTGWVRNVGDRRVEVLAEGDLAGLSTFLEYLRRGPRSAANIAVVSSSPVTTRTSMNMAVILSQAGSLEIASG